MTEIREKQGDMKKKIVQLIYKKLVVEKAEKCGNFVWKTGKILKLR